LLFSFCFFDFGGGVELFFFGDKMGGGGNKFHAIGKGKDNCTGHNLRTNCLLQQVIEGKIKEGINVTRRRGRMRRKLLDDLTERRGYSHLKEEALDRTLWRACFGKGFGPVVRQTAK